MRDQLLAELTDLNHDDDLALRMHRRLPARNTLAADDAHAVETAYQVALDAINGNERAEFLDPSSGFGSIGPQDGASVIDGSTTVGQQTATTVTPLRKAVRRRNKAHLAYVVAQPYLICRRSPCDAHHLSFAQPRALGRKVSDEFTVPLCREHHGELHRHGNEIALGQSADRPGRSCKRALAHHVIGGNRTGRRFALAGSPSDMHWSETALGRSSICA